MNATNLQPRVDAQPAEQAPAPPVTTGDLLLALFTLNRRAKRCRDLAQVYYQHGMHGFAGHFKKEKDAIYKTKEQVIHYLTESGDLKPAGYHKFAQHGNWAEKLEGGGFKFHRPCPEQEEFDGCELESVESKPKEAKELCLKQSREILSKYLSGKPVVNVFQWPPPVRQRRTVTCWNCGAEGHLARDCWMDDEDDEDGWDEEWD